MTFSNSHCAPWLSAAQTIGGFPHSSRFPVVDLCRCRGPFAAAAGVFPSLRASVANLSGVA